MFERLILENSPILFLNFSNFKPVAYLKILNFLIKILISKWNEIHSFNNIFRYFSLVTSNSFVPLFFYPYYCRGKNCLRESLEQVDWHDQCTLTSHSLNPSVFRRFFPSHDPCSASNSHPSVNFRSTNTLAT